MMKGIIKSFLIVFACVLIASPTFAGKPQNVISMSNGYPSGAHFNLIIHGKKTGNSDVVAEEVTTFNCPSGEGGGIRSLSQIMASQPYNTFPTRKHP